MLVLGILGSACGGSDAPPASSAGASTLQLRGVDDIVSRTSQEWGATELTCPGEDAAGCLASRSGVSVVVLGADQMEKYVLEAVVVDGGDVEEATAHPGTPASMGWSVAVQLSREGTDALASATQAALDAAPPRNRIAIVVDGLVVSSPTVAAPITSGAVVVAGGLSHAEAERLASNLSGD